ncbi:MAG: hypothetical protein LBV05_19665 [Comamonas sp.]|jgi:hypothetical protein|uniref:hypothetical protein n=1 Tax=Comamonas sp. TaxID=34028 RepID=UPI00284D10FE|nr:hypothetical protein [Comamonas sp.]MDR3067710.1 hypothetical protein [Comamonas sp.]
MSVHERKAVFIPLTVGVMDLNELSSRLAATIYNPDGTDADWSLHHDLARFIHADLVQAGEAGQLVTRHPIAHSAVPASTSGAVALVADVANYLEASGSRFRITCCAETLPFIGRHPNELVPLNDVAHLVAQAMHPETDNDEEMVQGYGLTQCEIELRIDRAAVLGELKLVNPRGREALPFRTTDACVTAGDLCKFFGTPSQSSARAYPSSSSTMQGSGDCEDVSRYTSIEEKHRYEQRVLEAADAILGEQEECMESLGGRSKTVWANRARVGSFDGLMPAPGTPAATAMARPSRSSLQDDSPSETPEQRRARLLEMLEDEEKLGARGALTRLATREGVDRSNLGKAIAKAKAERTEKVRAGGWTSQMVQGGKRTR